MNILKVVDTVTNALDSAKTPANILPPLLLKCTSMTRQGLSAYKIAAQVIQNNKLLGIPTGPNPDGSENKINQYTYNLIKCLVDGIKNDMSVQIAIPEESLLIKTTGTNAGGVCEGIGTNLIASIARGIAR